VFYGAVGNWYHSEVNVEGDETVIKCGKKR